MPVISRDGRSSLRAPEIPASSPAGRLAAFVEALAPLFALTGAGCSTGSGIPDYRDDNGEWKHGKPVQYADFRSSEHARRRYWARSLSGWPRIERSRPNGAHIALAQLERAGLIEAVCTQNVDALHEKAGSTSVIDLHGRLDGVECLECDARFSRALIQERLLELNPGYPAAGTATGPDGDVLLELPFDDFVPASCDHCGGDLKPSVVFFGEGVPVARVERAMFALERSRGMLVVGSSLMVYSGYRFCRRAQDLKKPIAALNRGKTRADGALSLKISMDCEAVLEQVVRILLG
jgi:NAD-dependent SIR2 family protein deacetylase